MKHYCFTVFRITASEAFDLKDISTDSLWELANQLSTNETLYANFVHDHWSQLTHPLGCVSDACKRKPICASMTYLVDDFNFCL